MRSVGNHAHVTIAGQRVALEKVKEIDLIDFEVIHDTKNQSADPTDIIVYL